MVVSLLRKKDTYVFFIFFQKKNNNFIFKINNRFGHQDNQTGLETGFGQAKAGDRSGDDVTAKIEMSFSVMSIISRKKQSNRTLTNFWMETVFISSIIDNSD